MAKEEARARDVLVTVLVRIRNVSIGEVRRHLDLGPRWPKLLTGGYYNHEPAPQDEVSKDVYAWSIIRELVKSGVFWVDMGAKDQAIWQSDFDSPVRRKFEDYGIQIAKGPSTVSPSGTVYGGSLEEATETLRARRPSRFFVDAYRAYWAPIRQAQDALATLTAADYSALSQYIRSGAALEPDVWSLKWRAPRTGHLGSASKGPRGGRSAVRSWRNS